MARNTGNNNQAGQQVRIASLGQYAKKSICEVIKTPYELSQLNNIKPKIGLNITTSSKSLGDNNHEVSLVIDAIIMAEERKENMLKAMLEYCGVIKIEGDITETMKDEILLVNCATLLFPFARQRLADAILSGGYQPIMLDPVDFRQLYLQSKQNRPNGLDMSETIKW